MQGFTYAGKHSSEMKVYYVPDAIQRGDFYAEYDVISDEHAWHDGGHYYKSRVRTREFQLDCFYDCITEAEREKILMWLDRRTSGELVFDDRPYASYFVRPSKKIEFKEYTQLVSDEKLYSATFTIAFNAYSPYATLTYASLDEHDTPVVRLATGLMAASVTPADISLTNVTGNPALTTSGYLGYNAGSEVSDTIIEFEGKTGSGDLHIRNLTNGDACTIKQGFTTASGEVCRISSKTGRFERVTDVGAKIDFAYHDDGYITYAPAAPIVRDAVITATSGSKSITAAHPVFSEDMEWNYVRIGGAWALISSVESATQATLNLPASASGQFTTNIVKMNLIAIDAASDASISRLTIHCIPEVR